MTTRDDKDKEPFLTRWARLKREAAEEAAKAPVVPERKSTESGAPPALPPLDQLTLGSDFRQFFHPKVSEQLRRAALKKLFSDPHFNTMDGLDVYIEDYSKFEPLPPEMLAALKQAQNLLDIARSEEGGADGQVEEARRGLQAPEASPRLEPVDRAAPAEMSRPTPAEPEAEVSESRLKPAGDAEVR